MSGDDVSLDVVDHFRPRTDRALLRGTVAETLAFAGRRELEVSLLLTDDAGIAELHGQFMNDPTPTDVMSFDDEDSVDVVVNVQRARDVAAEHGTTIRAELALYLVHGLLHACGHDDIDNVDRARMRVGENEVMTRLRLRHAPVDPT